MYQITGFSYKRVLLITVFFAFLSTIGSLIVFTHISFEEHPFLCFISTLVISLLILFSQLYIFKKKLNKHKKVFKDFIDQITDVIVFKDFNGNFLFCNKAVADLYDSTPEEMIGKDDFYFTRNRDEADFFRNNIREIILSGEKQEVYETSTDAKTGETRHFVSMKIPYQDARKNNKILVIAKDITELISLREDAYRNKRRLEHVLDVSEEGLWEWNTQTNEVLHNDQWLRIFGLERSENTFMEFQNSIIDEDKQKVSDALQDLVMHDQPYSIEFRVKRSDGRVIWIWDRGKTSEYDEDGKAVWLAGICQDITQEKNNQQRINNLAYKDQLTGLVNRSQMTIELNKAIERSAEEERYSAVLFLDLDRFKLLNDSYGHHLGDKLLIEVAHRLKKLNEGFGIVSRFGGDEFVIVLPALDVSQVVASKVAHKYAKKVINEIIKTYTLVSDVQDLTIDYSITCSIGGVVSNDQNISSEKLIQLADLALYQAKDDGGNTVKIFDTQMQDELYQTSELKKEMHNSIANKDFIIALQPQYDIEENIVGAEALVRWNHPERGILPPGAFIDMAEESNLIIEIGDQVLELACLELEKWQKNEKTYNLTLSVNLSAKQIWQTTFVEDVISLVSKYEIDYSKLTLEVTESLLIMDIEDAMQKLTKLKEYGFNISLDDFGTGYSSLSYLRALPISEIKIDRSFVMNLTSELQSQLVVKSIIDLANNFNLHLISEGIEDKDQLNILKNYGVTTFQGFYFSRPISVDEMDKLLGL